VIQKDLFTEAEITTSSPAIAKPFVSRSTFYQGDCLIEMDKITDKSIDLIIADLPYGTTKNKWDIIIPFEPMWEQYKRVAKKDAAILLFGSGLFLYQLAMSNQKMFKYELIWHKSKSGSSFTAKYRPVQKHENILVFGNGKIKYNPQLEVGEPYYRKRKPNNGDKPNNHKLGLVSESETFNDGFRYPSTVQFFQQKWRRQDQKHPTEKPVELMEWLVNSYSNEGDTVLDSCMGSCPVGVACKKLNRNFIGIENDKEHFATSVSRVSEYCG